MPHAHLLKVQSNQRMSQPLTLQTKLLCAGSDDGSPVPQSCRLSPGQKEVRGRPFAETLRETKAQEKQRFQTVVLQATGEFPLFVDLKLR